MLPREIFEILHAVMALLVLFEQLLGKFYFNFFTLILSTLPKYGVFCSHLNIIVRAYGVRLVTSLSKRFEIMENLYLSKT